MTRAQQTWIIVTALFISVAVLVYFFAPKNGANENFKRQKILARATDSLGAGPAMKEPAATPYNMQELPKASPIEADVPVGKAYVEKFDDGVSLKFVPTAKFRQLIEFRRDPIPANVDSTCSKPYTVREKVTKCPSSAPMAQI